MAWQSRFLAVPTGQLKNVEQVAPTAKATPDQLRAYMGQVSAVYKSLRTGTSPEDFARMQASSDRQVRAVGDAHYYLFSPAGIDHRLEAEFIEGQGFVVTRGHHRVEAAEQIGVPYLPVHVRAPDEASLDRVTRATEAPLQASAPDVVMAQRQLDDQHRQARGATQERGTAEPSVSASPDRTVRSGSTGPDAPTRSGPSRDRSRS